eukprot:CAMPEP_0201517396 /NCGR_PEP_ID=MMETSP0161_2-20130828/8511_1 /ASSEMBLY_ACC=CAM_ASM_000251 /TAXON_ID=180227 /ORGANISM="Neoparamoeba aestuarina, Strain SoJaBio B1-5/56/2" /LENGTH=315 /DNA_ID=CAMNT_0047914879 /DNA_START=813 /DNA_END=1757 /DNA_ORIENTATION=-
MLIIAIVHSHTYAPEEFIRQRPEGTEEGWNLDEEKQISVWDALSDVIQPSDFWEDSYHSFKSKGENEQEFDDFLILPMDEREEQTVKSGWILCETPSPEAGCRLVERRYAILLQNGHIFVVDNDPFKEFNKRKDMVSNQLEFVDDEDQLLHHEEEERSKIRSIRWFQLPRITAINYLDSVPLRRQLPKTILYGDKLEASSASSPPSSVPPEDAPKCNSDELFDRLVLRDSFPISEQKVVIEREEGEAKKEGDEVEIEMTSVVADERGEEEEEGEVEKEGELGSGAALEFWARNPVANMDYIALSLRGSKKEIDAW